MAEQDFIFSVVIPVFNTEKYLAECVESVLNQTIGFENIQLILVNNASTDGSGEICKYYLREYPDNVEIIIIEENIGPSYARNVGMDAAKGKYTVFLDSDDKWALNAFEIAYAFFEEHYDEIDFVACRIKSFEASEAWHALDYVFTSDRIVDIRVDYDCIISTVHAIYKTEILDNFRAKEEIYHNEDSLFTTEVILNKMRYGALRSAVYLYRRRANQSSLLQTIKREERYFTIDFDGVHSYLLEESKKRFGKVLPYIQFLLMYCLQWRLMDAVPEWMEENQLQEYTEKIRKVLLQIDDHIILEQRNIRREYKIFCLRLKYGDDVYKKFKLIDRKILFNNLAWYTTDNKTIFSYYWHEASDGVLRLAGEVDFPFPKEDYEIFAVDGNGNRYDVLFDASDEKVLSCLGQECLAIRPFELVIPLENVSSLQFILRYRNVETALYINAKKFSRLSIQPRKNYFIDNGYIFSRDEKSIIVERCNAITAIKHRLALCKGLLKRGERKLILRRIFQSHLFFQENA